MKKHYLALPAIIAIFCLFLVSCGNKESASNANNDENKDIISFDSVSVRFIAVAPDGADSQYTSLPLSNTKLVLKGSQLEAPELPEITGYLFDGWYNGDVKWSFEEMTA